MPIGTAVRYLKKHEWQKAHVIVQEDGSTLGCWAHGIVHMQEGDVANARYWYRKAHRDFPKDYRRGGGNRRAGARRQGRDAMNAPLILPTSGIQPEIAVAAVPDDERVWVPQAQDVWFRPLLLNTVSGGWCNLLRVRRSGVLSRHRHPMVVIGYVIKGRWKYLEHDWTAEEGSFVYEPPGEIHTLTVPADCPEMITFFNISGAMIYLDADGRQNGYEDVWSKIDMCRNHYAQCGLGAQYVEQFIR